VGRFLFGWWDRSKNRRRINEEAFFADCYAAFYKVITLGQMRQCLQSSGLEIVEFDPPINIDMWLDVRRNSPSFAMVKKLLRKVPALKPLATFAIRLRQFTSYGSLRSVVVRKL
jgi:hypothetical protein